jgi:dTDP-4-amino-4,6-dideoxygalactose transaminase
MDIIPFSMISGKDWDQVVYSSMDGWVFSLHGWLEMVSDVWAIYNYSFGIRENGKLVAVMPLHFVPSEKRLSSSGWGHGGPVILSSVLNADRWRLWKGVLQHVDKIGVELSAESVTVSISPLTQSSLKSYWGVNPLNESGYMDVSTHTRILQLEKPEEELWFELAKDARQQINKARAAGYTARRIDWPEMLENYYRVHVETYQRTGVRPHPKAYFQGIADLSNMGNSILWVGFDPAGNPVAFHNDACYGDTAMYHTGCSLGDHLKSGINYLLFWQAIIGEKIEGRKWYEAGEVFLNATEGKEKGLTDFKMKFGGEIHRIYRGEKKYTKIQVESTQVESKPVQSISREPFRLKLSRWLLATRDILTYFLGQKTVGFLQKVLVGSYRLVKKSLQPVLKASSTAKRFFESNYRKIFYSRIQFIKPYWSEDEFSCGKGENSKDIEKSLDNFILSFRSTLNLPDSSFIVPVGSGRVALELILRALKKKYPGRDKVLITTYGCRGVYDPVIRCGLKPVLLDITPELIPNSAQMLSALGPDVLACLTVNLCGMQMDIAPILSAAQKFGVLVVEDCCQSTGNHLYFPGQMQPDFQTYSFGGGKNLSATAGGAVVAFSHHHEIEEVRKELLDEPPSNAHERFSYLYPQFFTEQKPDPKVSLAARLYPYENFTSMNRVDASILNYQLEKIHTIIERRRKNANQLLQEIRKYPQIFSIQNTEKHIYTKLSVILRDTTLHSQFLQHMADYGVELENMYIPLHIRPDVKIKYLPYDMSTSEKVYQQVINIPVRPNLKRGEVLQIKKAIRLFGKRFS